jgi:hypothetical protein
VVFLLQSGREDLDLNETVVASVVDGGTDGREINVAISRHSTAAQASFNREHPVGDLARDDVSGTARQFLVEARIPEHVVGVEVQSEVGIVKGIDQIVGLLEGDNDGAILDEHRVEGFDTQDHACVDGPGQNCLDSGTDHVAGLLEWETLSGAAYQNQRLGVEGGGFLDGPVVVIDSLAKGQLRGRWKHATPAHCADSEPGLLNESYGGRKTGFPDLLAPYSDSGYPTVLAGGHQLRDRPLWGGDLVEAEPGVR